MCRATQKKTHLNRLGPRSRAACGSCVRARASHYAYQRAKSISISPAIRDGSLRAARAQRGELGNKKNARARTRTRARARARTNALDTQQTSLHTCVPGGATCGDARAPRDTCVNHATGHSVTIAQPLAATDHFTARNTNKHPSKHHTTLICIENRQRKRTHSLTETVEARRGRRFVKSPFYIVAVPLRHRRHHRRCRGSRRRS